MSFVQLVLLVTVAAGGLAVVLVRQPARQAIVSSIYGLLLGLLFFAFQAPDVALSEIVVASVALPVLLLLTLAKLARIEEGEE